MPMLSAINIIALRHVAEVGFGNIKRPTWATQQQQQSSGTFRKGPKQDTCT